MTYGEIAFRLEESSPFRYTCNRCTRCCHHQRIMLNPYEVLRLARNLGITTGEAISRYTGEAGTVLRFDGPDNGCVFLRPDGCSVHPDRPLACRLYPLGRYVTASGHAAFGQTTPPAGSAGRFADPDELGADDTVDRFLQDQGAPAYIRAAERYYALFLRLYHLAEYQEASDDGALEWRAEDADGWADADAWVADYCARHAMPIPESVDAVMELHIAAISEWADRVTFSGP